MFRILASALAILPVAACGDDSAAPDAGADANPAETWTVIHRDLAGALMSVWGSSASDVWAVGGDAGDGPMVIHWDGIAWTRMSAGISGDLWWVYGFAGGPVFMGGQQGHIVRYEAGAFTPMTTPGTGTVFGIWGADAGDLWAVGGNDGGASGAFAWRSDGGDWVEAPGFPTALAADKAIWKVWGSTGSDVWLVGTAGQTVHWDGDAFEAINVGGGESLFTVHQAGDRFAAVGGFATGLVFEYDGTEWQRVSDPSFPPLVGVCLTEDGGGYAVGGFGSFMERQGGVWIEREGPLTSETLHGIWVDPDGGQWTVGGQVQALPLVRGVLAYRGRNVPMGELQ